MTCGGLKMSGKFLPFTLALWLAGCSQGGPTRAQSDKTQAPAQASTPQGSMQLS